MGTVVAEMPEETMGPHRREAVEAAMGEAIETGQRAGLTEEELRETVGSLRIPTGSRKAALVHLALEAWRAGLINPRAVGEVRGRAMMRRRRDD